MSGPGRRPSRLGLSAERLRVTGLNFAPPQKPIQRQQASPRRSVMSRAEGERRLDLDRDRVRRNLSAMMSALDHEAPGANDRKPFETLFDPVLLRDRLEPKSSRDLVVRRAGDQRP